MSETIPETFPADVWEATRAALDRGDMAFMTVARAIMADRERCAKIVDAECKRVLELQDGKDDRVDMNLRLSAVLLPNIAAAIRGTNESA